MFDRQGERASNQQLSAPDDYTDPVIEAYKKDVDRTLLRENLKLTVEGRFHRFEAFWQFAQELRGAALRPVSKE